MSPPIKAGVIGYPIAHSLSPVIHRYWLKHYGIRGTYDAIEVRPEELEDFLTRRMAEENYVGVNVTLPHKVKIYEWLDRDGRFPISHKEKPSSPSWDAANFSHAVNTLVFDPVNSWSTEPKELVGINTDYAGFIYNVRASITAAPRNKAVVLGAGGASRSILLALCQEESVGMEEIVLLNRTREHAEEIHKYLRGRNFIGVGNLGEKVKIADWSDRHAALEGASLLVNTTSLGMKGKPPLEIDLSRLPKDALVTDIVYNPLETDLLKQARARGNPTKDGLGMLLHQAAPSFEKFYRILPEVTPALRSYVLDFIQ